MKGPRVVADCMLEDRRNKLKLNFADNAKKLGHVIVFPRL
jgi:hypothetical protein